MRKERYYAIYDARTGRLVQETDRLSFAGLCRDFAVVWTGNGTGMDPFCYYAWNCRQAGWGTISHADFEFATRSGNRS